MGTGGKRGDRDGGGGKKGVCMSSRVAVFGIVVQLAVNQVVCFLCLLIERFFLLLFFAVERSPSWLTKLKVLKPRLFASGS